MDLGTVYSSICKDFEMTYGLSCEVWSLPYGEGDYNFEIVPAGSSNSVCAKVYLYYEKIVFELGLLNVPGIRLPVFRVIQRKVAENGVAVSEIEKTLSEKGCSINWEVNQKRFGLYSSIAEINWDVVGLRVKSPFIPVYSQFDIHYEAIKEYVILFSGLIVAMTDFEKPDFEGGFVEGTSREVLSVQHERNPLNRAVCLRKKGYRCSVCGLDMGERYGEIGRGYIEVHHAVPVSTYTVAKKIDPEKELFPLCPNCHAMVHRRNPPYSIEELKEILKNRKDNG